MREKRLVRYFSFVSAFLLGAVMLPESGISGFRWSGTANFDVEASLRLQRHPLQKDEMAKVVFEFPVILDIDSESPVRRGISCPISVPLPGREGRPFLEDPLKEECFGGRLRLAGEWVPGSELKLRVSHFSMTVDRERSRESQTVFMVENLKASVGDNFQRKPQLRGELTYRRGSFVGGYEWQANWVTRNWVSFVWGRAFYIGMRLPLLYVDKDKEIAFRTVRCGKIIGFGSGVNGLYSETNLCEEFGSSLAANVSTAEFVGDPMEPRVETRDDKVELKINLFPYDAESSSASRTVPFWSGSVNFTSDKAISVD